MKLFQTKTLYGCEERGDKNSPYLTRFTFLQTRFGQVCLHIFHRSDGDEMHDHPWNFVSIVLWRGYIEVTERGDENLSQERIRQRVWPGFILFRPARWRHRVELVNGKRAVTLVFMGARVREWGFFTAQGWLDWRTYFRRKGC
jgi:hypothetical protein